VRRASTSPSSHSLSLLCTLLCDSRIHNTLTSQHTRASNAPDQSRRKAGPRSQTEFRLWTDLLFYVPLCKQAAIPYLIGQSTTSTAYQRISTSSLPVLCSILSLGRFALFYPLAGTVLWIGRGSSLATERQRLWERVGRIRPYW
jgi:hypothetical protein